MNSRDQDCVDAFRAAWHRALPDIDTTPMSVLGRMHRIAHLVRPSIEATFARYEIDRGEFDVLATLRRSPPPHRLTPTQLYQSLMISSGGLTNRLTRLEKARLIRREQSKVDGRSLVVVLTDAGMRRAEEAFRADMASESQWLAALSPAEQRTLAGLLRKMLVHLESQSAANAPDEGGR